MRTVLPALSFSFGSIILFASPFDFIIEMQIPHRCLQVYNGSRSFPVYLPSEFFKVLPLAPGAATTYPLESATKAALFFPGTLVTCYFGSSGHISSNCIRKKIQVLYFHCICLFFSVKKYSSGIYIFIV